MVFNSVRFTNICTCKYKTDIQKEAGQNYHFAEYRQDSEMYSTKMYIIRIYCTCNVTILFNHQKLQLAVYI